MSEPKELPFEDLGNRLRLIRQKLHESAADVSGAVEIDESVLAEFESGSRRPTKDILSLLISHFGIQDDDAANLWQLAGYERPKETPDEDFIEDGISSRPGVLVVAIDPRVIYSDGVQVNASKNGVVLHFAQTSGSQQQPMVTARVGMSREQARSVISTLQAALDRTEPRQLPSSSVSDQASSPEPTQPQSGDKKD